MTTTINVRYTRVTRVICLAAAAITVVAAAAASRRIIPDCPR